METAKLIESIKTKASLITTVFSTVAAIGGAVIYINNNYAQAADVKEILANQQQILQLQRMQQQSTIVFQLEYYDDRIRRLNAELAQAEALNAQTRNQIKIRPLNEIKSDLEDTKNRREITRNIIMAPSQGIILSR
jgi:hypothetical protein